jgi:uncharacterized protein YjiS (DUF1127 family)
MSANYPVLPVGGSALVRVFASVLAVVTHWLKEFARARRHRRQANVLAGLDRHMLADIGITRTDVRDAFSEPFWDDPTALLRDYLVRLPSGLLLGHAFFALGDRRVPVGYFALEPL